MKKLFLFLVAATTLAACKKDNDGAPTLSKTDLLTARNWRVSAQTSTSSASGTSTTTDDYATMSACERDDFTKFNTNKTLTADAGATKCSPSDPQTEMGAWDFNSDQTKLNLKTTGFGGLLVPFDIVELSSTTLHLRYSNMTNGITETEDITFTAF